MSDISPVGNLLTSSPLQMFLDAKVPTATNPSGSGGIPPGNGNSPHGIPPGGLDRVEISGLAKLLSSQQADSEGGSFTALLKAAASASGAGQSGGSANDLSSALSGAIALSLIA
ncbi:MAG: hypothetical protein PHU85_07770 [Phycisphaerae bacterium]|nr:hypothetical protein [Phycisphaerae bacterium]